VGADSTSPTDVGSVLGFAVGSSSKKENRFANLFPAYFFMTNPAKLFLTEIIRSTITVWVYGGLEVVGFDTAYSSNFVVVINI